MFVNKFIGRIDGDLVVDRFRVELDKRALAATRPNAVVFPLTTGESQAYSQYLNWQKTSGALGTLTVVKSFVPVSMTMTDQSAMTVASGALSGYSTQNLRTDSVTFTQPQITASIPSFTIPISTGFTGGFVRL